ncbi:MAG: Tim44/TimA family putative adaptor protein [Sphingomonadaceae bacterium]
MYMIVILALVAAFLALRLYSVLGRRTGHEQQPAPLQGDERMAKPVQAEVQPGATADRTRFAESIIAPGAENGIRAIIAADRNFDVPQFLEGARSAYGMILEAFWKGKRDDLHWLCDSDVAQSFEQAIDEREAAGQVLDNRLVRIDKAQIVEASLVGRTAHVTIQFDADIAAITRDKDGQIIAGTMTDAVATHDLWTFTREIGHADPNWKLSETDEAQ